LHQHSTADQDSCNLGLSILSVPMDCLHPAQQALLFYPSKDLQQYKTDPMYFWISIATKHYGMRKKKMIYIE